jgi:hypothetical protein
MLNSVTSLDSWVEVEGSGWSRRRRRPTSFAAGELGRCSTMACCSTGRVTSPLASLEPRSATQLGQTSRLPEVFAVDRRSVSLLEAGRQRLRNPLNM